MTFKSKIIPLGDSALLIQMGDEIDLATNQRVHALATLINAFPLAGVIETVPAYGTLLVHYDPLLLSFGQTKNYLREKLTQVQDYVSRKHRQVEVPVRYAGDYGIDLEAVAHHCQLQTKDVIRIHAEKIYTVFMM